MWGDSDWEEGLHLCLAAAEIANFERRNVCHRLCMCAAYRDIARVLAWIYMFVCVCARHVYLAAAAVQQNHLTGVQQQYPIVLSHEKVTTHLTLFCVVCSMQIFLRSPANFTRTVCVTSLHMDMYVRWCVYVCLYVSVCAGKCVCACVCACVWYIPYHHSSRCDPTL